MPTKRLAIPFALGEGQNKTAPAWIQVMRTGKFDHPEYGEFEITPATLQEMRTNFNNRVRRVDLSVDYFHENDKLAAGWFAELDIREAGTQLWARIDWTPKAAASIAEREIRYFSPEWAPEYTDAETKQVFKNVLFGGGLTNRPFLKDMSSIVNNEKGETLKLEEVQKELADTKQKLSDAVKAQGDAEKKAADMMPQMDAKDKEIADLKAKIAELEAKLQTQAADAKMAAEKAAKESAFQKLLTEGKAVPAQKDAFMSGDTVKFAESAQPVNLNANGNGGGNSGGDGEVTEEKILELAETKRKADGTLSMGDAIKAAKKELSKK